MLIFWVCVQKLRVKFVTKRNQRKRQRDEIPEKERDKKSPVKRAKTSDLPVKEQDIKSETLNSAQPDDDKTKVKEEDKTVDHVDEVKMVDETDVVKMENEKDVVKMEDESDDEDPEEDPEEDEEMEESGTQHDLPNVNKEEKTDVSAPQKVEGNEKDKAEDSSKDREKPKPAETELKSDGNEKTDSKADTGKKETSTDTVKKETSTVTEVAIDKELLQVCFWELFAPFCYFPISVIARLLHALVIILMLIFKF